MSNIILKKLNLINFKGIKNLSLEFNDSTNIFGANGTGKTTIFDSFTWLLFGKDSSDRKDFQIKTLDKFNVAIPKIEHEVNAIIHVDDEEISIRRILKEKWVKTKGALEAEFSGNETLYYWNEVPLSQKEFQSKVSQVLDEAIFKLITSPSAFNSLKWQDRRNVLIQIVGEISDHELASGNSDYEKLLSQLSNKSLEEYKKQIAATIKKAKEDIKTIPTRIDEVERSKPDPVDETEIQTEITSKEKLIENLDNQLQNKAAAYDEVIKKRNANQDEIFNLKSQLNAIEFEVKERVKLESKSDSSKKDQISKKLEDVRSEIRSSEATLKTFVDKKSSLEIQVSSLNTLIENGRNQWNEINSKELVFNENEFCCPTCKREFEASDVEAKKTELKDNFIQEKQDQLKRIAENGKANTSEKSNLDTEIETLESRISKGKEYIESLYTKENGLKADLILENKSEGPAVNFDVKIGQELSVNENYNSIKLKISELESLKFDLDENNDAEIKSEKQKINTEIAELRSKLHVNAEIKKADVRISELLDEENNLAQNIADIEKTQYVIDNFIKLKIDTIEGKINEKFSFVKFKLFDTQINGGQVECCDALIDGVPFSDANTASRINAGVDIINTLCQFYKVSAPIFIDNRESVVDLIESNSQIINLIVSGSDKKLRVS